MAIPVPANQGKHLASAGVGLQALSMAVYIMEKLNYGQSLQDGIYVYESICPRPFFDDRKFLVQLCPANWQRTAFVVSRNGAIDLIGERTLK